jgi:hypothetical protein
MLDVEDFDRAANPPHRTEPSAPYEVVRQCQIAAINLKMNPASQGYDCHRYNCEDRVDSLQRTSVKIRNMPCEALTIDVLVPSCIVLKKKMGQLVLRSLLIPDVVTKDLACWK